MAMKQRLMIATAAALVLCAGEAMTLFSSANSTEVHASAEQASALTASPQHQASYPTVAHPAYDAWAAVFRSTAR